MCNSIHTYSIYSTIEDVLKGNYIHTAVRNGTRIMHSYECTTYINFNCTNTSKPNIQTDILKCYILYQYIYIPKVPPEGHLL